jgi:hypothetical protein
MTYRKMHVDKLVHVPCSSILKIQEADMDSILCIVYCSFSERGCRCDGASPLYTKYDDSRRRTYYLCSSEVNVKIWEINQKRPSCIAIVRWTQQVLHKCGKYALSSLAS